MKDDSTPGAGRTAAVVGGGWSGIATAWYLQLAGYQVTLYDEGATLGGRSAGAKLGDRTVTLGGKNIGSKYALFRSFTNDMDAGGYEHFGINSSRVENGRIRTVDGNSKFRAVVGLLRHARPADTVKLARMVRTVRSAEENRFLRGPGFTGLARGGDVSLDRVFGSYVSRQIIRPMTVRMNGAEPDEAYLGNLGTNLGMLLDRFDQLSAGFDAAFSAFAARVATRQGSRVERLLTDGGTVTGVSVRGPDGASTEHRADTVVLAIPSWDAADLVRPLSEPLAGLLREITYFPVAVAMAEYGRPVFTEDVRALVLPPDSPLSNAGAYGVGDRHIVRYTFSGRAARPFLDGAPDAAALVERGEQELTRHIPVPADTRTHLVAARWQRGLCAYGADHDRRLARIGAETGRIPHLLLTGDYVRGASIEACFRAARDTTAPLTSAGAAPPATAPADAPEPTVDALGERS